MNRETLALAERYDRLARDLEDQTIDRLDRAIDQSYRNLEREFLRQYPEMQAQGSLLASQRRAVLMNDLSALLAIIRPEQAEEYEQLFQRMIVAASGLGGDLAGAMLEAIAPDSFARAFAGINLEAVALQARDGARRLYRYNEEFQGKASAIVEQGLIQGWGARRVADSLRSEMGVAKFNAERIARTEVMSALNDGAQLRYQQAGIEAVQWVVTPSEGLCPICAARNGQVYPIGKVRVPIHPFDRCLLLPWRREWQEAGLTDDEFTADYRNRVLRELKAGGKQAQDRVAAFEKAGGLEKPPTPIWKP
ncbi:minor capsid protein [Leptolyngbya ohadii]|uniref:minor capsid protein n=1 Tax=Leptolyngbya ohadii TaxID=1962290 RepID=UPI000B598A0F|nr:minor capsid protein [Leptolyngbya ohadii]